VPAGLDPLHTGAALAQRSSRLGHAGGAVAAIIPPRSFSYFQPGALYMNKFTLPLVALTLAASVSALAVVPASAPSVAETNKETKRAIKHDAHATASAVESGVETAASAVGTGVKKTGHAIKKGAEKVKAAVTPASASN
jgi:hypothetical protein